MMKAESVVVEQEHTAPTRHSRFGLFVIFLVVTVNLIDRQIVNILAQDIKVELALSDAELGLLTGSAFGVVYAVAGLPAAWLADRLNRPRLIAVMLAFWSICTVACGIAGSFIALFLARMGVGAGEGGAQPACTALARDLSSNRPTTALALMMTGNPIGSFIGIFAGGIVAEYWGWRSAFILVGLPGLLLAALLYFSVRETRVIFGTSGGNWLLDAVRIVSKPGIPKLIALCSACLFIMYSGAAWLPAHFIRVHGVTTGEMGVYAGLAIGIGGGIGCLASMSCDRLSQKFKSIESIFLTVNMLAIIPCLFLILFANDLTIALAGLFLFDILAYAWLAPATKLLQDAVQPEQRALAFAVCGGAGILFSLGAGLPLTGWLSDLLTPDHQSRALGISLGASITIAAIVAVVTVQAYCIKLRGNP